MMVSLPTHIYASLGLNELTIQQTVTYIYGSNLVKSRLPITYCLVAKAFWNFAERGMVHVLRKFVLLGHVGELIFHREISPQIYI